MRVGDDSDRNDKFTHLVLRVGPESAPEALAALAVSKARDAIGAEFVRVKPLVNHRYIRNKIGRHCFDI